MSYVFRKAHVLVANDFPSPINKILLIFSGSRIDPAQELAKVRRSLTLLETYVLGSSSSPASFLEVAGGQLDYLDQAISSAPSVPAPHRAEEKASKTESPQPVDYSDKSDAPGSLGRQTGGLYAGPTSAATLLISVSSLRLLFCWPRS